MDLEKVTLYSSLVLLGGFVAREIIKSKIRVHTMAIKRSQLQAFQDDETVKTLHFNPYYDDVFLAKDRISLTAYKETTDETKSLMDFVQLEKTGETKIFDNQRNYSAYKLEKAKGDLKTVLDLFPDATKVIYILFKPVQYSGKGGYLAYQLLAADALKNPIAKTEMVVLQPAPAYALAEEGSNASRSASVQALALATSGSLGSVRMNPSPPATRNTSGGRI